ncbi:helix-turn-helix domain-containing protein [Lentzea sp. NPDC102401]|uniref:helix-turn-helix domain-containing protein n=1 Tax=Lentzea sp. NPDC102401 TaxID=3364128 RepID=UPI00381BE9B8
MPNGQSVTLTAQPVRRLTSQERTTLMAQLKARYQNGASIRELAAETEYSYGTIHRLLGLAGVTFRGRGGSRKRSVPGTSVAARTLRRR